MYMYTCTSNPWESNHRDGPMGHKIALKTVMMLHCMLYMYRMYTCVHVHVHVCLQYLQKLHVHV